jgi:sirohydrochlorin ferrochelatase
MTSTAAPPAAKKTVAAVLVSHGDRGGTDPNATLRAQAEAVRDLTHLDSVTFGVLKGTPSVEEALEAAEKSGATDILVCPLFMADGYFAGRVLPHRLDEANVTTRIHTLPPLGLDPRIAGLLLADAADAASRTGFALEKTNLLIVGHGSKFGPASANATKVVAELAAAVGVFASVATAFLEEAPFLEQALANATAPTVVAGFFFGEGMHAAEDVPEAIARTHARAVYSGVVGTSPRIPHLIASALTAVLSARHDPERS